LPPPNYKYLNHEKCQAYFANGDHRFHQLWGNEGWRVRQKGGWSCFGSDRGQGWRYFDDAWWGRDCARNWYTGNGGNLGDPQGGPTRQWVWPHFDTKLNPALLGFDESIDQYCWSHGGQGGGHAATCVRAGVNILSLYGDEIPYNICRNVEWQVCAAKGTLPGQGSRKIRFAYAPKLLEPESGPKPIGNCDGYMPAGCGNRGYASSDIYYMEACVYSMMCKNRDEFWRLDAEQDFVCDMNWEGYSAFRDYLLDGGATAQNPADIVLP